MPLMERRTDVGLKIVYVILTAIITLVLSLFFNKTYNLAESASTMSYEVKQDVAVLQSEFKNINSKLEKIDIKIDKLLYK